MSCFRVQSYGHNHDNASIWIKKLHAFALFVNKLGILTSTLSKTHILSFCHYYVPLHNGCIKHLLQKKLPASTEVSGSKSPSVLTGNHYLLTESANGVLPIITLQSWRTSRRLPLQSARDTDPWAATRCWLCLHRDLRPRGIRDLWRRTNDKTWGLELWTTLGWPPYAHQYPQPTCQPAWWR